MNESIKIDTSRRMQRLSGLSEGAVLESMRLGRAAGSLECWSNQRGNFLGKVDKTIDTRCFSRRYSGKKNSSYDWKIGLKEGNARGHESNIEQAAFSCCSRFCATWTNLPRYCADGGRRPWKGSWDGILLASVVRGRVYLSCLTDRLTILSCFFFYLLRTRASPQSQSWTCCSWRLDPYHRSMFALLIFPPYIVVPFTVISSICAQSQLSNRFVSWNGPFCGSLVTSVMSASKRPKQSFRRSSSNACMILL